MLAIAGLILILVIGLIALSLLATSRIYERRLVVWQHHITTIRKDRIRAWQSDLAEWFKAIPTPAPQKYPEAGLLSDAGLEALAAELFSKIGYETKVVGGSGDKGVDVHMRNPEGDVEIVQCKQWRKPVGSPEVLHFIGAMQKAGAVYGYIIAPHGFTRPAMQDVQGYNILLVNETALQHLMGIIERYSQATI